VSGRLTEIVIVLLSVGFRAECEALVERLPDVAEFAEAVPDNCVILTLAVLNALIEKFNIMPITTVENDLKACLKAA